MIEKVGKRALIAEHFREMLALIGEDPDREGLLDTPDRVARMYEELFSGLRENPSVHLEKTFLADNAEMIIVKDIPFFTVCEHHFVPFHGVVPHRLHPG